MDLLDSSQEFILNHTLPKITKVDGEFIKNSLTRLNANRLRFIYVGCTNDPTKLIMGTHLEEDFKFGDPSQVVGIIRLNSEYAINVITTLLNTFGISVVSSIPYIVDLGKIMSMCNKVKWDLTRIATLSASDGSVVAYISDMHDDEHQLISLPFSTYFAFSKVLSVVEDLDPAISNTLPNIIDIKMDLGSGNLSPTRFCLKKKYFENTDISKIINRDTNIYITPGAEYLKYPKALLEKLDLNHYTYTLRIWTQDNKSIHVGGYYSDENFTLLTRRAFLFLALIPREGDTNV